MYDMLKVILGAIVVGDFLLAIGFFALWQRGECASRRRRTRRRPRTPMTDKGEAVC